ncbi:hypothetical protein JZ751_020317 [Albula glossodonta]|uniref:non-specific serine/threonine protein kinase n=1 Tax=Albula glossodonta TaxID=121402 RepID=A0A8T2NM27_9TELE|nr:hypothetical protein JZ751_020317 [Albula glossodonta]
MSSRRPLLRSFSANGRYGSFNVEDVMSSSGRADGRNYLNMRTDNRQSHYKELRSTLCSVMAQLAVETQPSFETTLKSKAVSESCNVKFTCVVSGNPAPELTWYKDDVEMDRYCGLPKYEIFSNGKTHTLQIYNCTQEDAAIYQASARNSKGIVSCSGVLEVGAMNEFKIHQRFFTNLKRKAEGKLKDQEQGRVPVATDPPRTVSPVRAPRRIISPSEPGLTPSASVQDAKPLVQEVQSTQKPKEQPPVAAEKPLTNGFAGNPEPAKEKGKPNFLYVRNTVEIITTRPATKDTLSRKMIKISRVESTVPNGDSTDATSSGPGDNKEASQGGMRPAQNLTESSNPELSGNQQSTTAELHEAPKPEPHLSHQAVREREKSKQKGTPERGPPSTVAPEERLMAEAAAQKEPQSPNAFTSMFFSLRDMFFRSKNKTEDAAVANGMDAPQVHCTRMEEREPPIVPPLHQPETPQARQQEVGVIQTPPPHKKPNEMDWALPSVAHAKSETSQKLQTLNLQGSPTAEDRQRSEQPTMEVPRAGDSLTEPPPCQSKTLCLQPPTVDWNWSPETAPMTLPPAETNVAVHRTQMNGSDTPSKQSQNMHCHANRLDKSQAGLLNGPQNSVLDRGGDPDGPSEHWVTLAVASCPAEQVAEKDVGIGASLGASGDSNLRLQSNTVHVVQDPAEMGGAEILISMIQKKEPKISEKRDDNNINNVPSVVREKAGTEVKENPMNVAPKCKTEGLSGEKCVTDVLVKPPMVVQVKLPDVTQLGEALQKVPEVPGNAPVPTEIPGPKPELHKLELSIPKVPQIPDQMNFLKTRTVDIIQPPTPFADNMPANLEPSNSLKDSTEVRASVMAESPAEAIPVIPALQDVDSSDGFSLPKEIQSTALKDQGAKTAEETHENSHSQKDAGISISSVPIISVSVEDGTTVNKAESESQLKRANSPIVIRSPPKVPTFVVPPITITSTESNPEDNQASAEEVKESLATLQGIKCDPCVTNPEVGRKVTAIPHNVEKITTTKESSTMENNRDVSLGITIPELEDATKPPLIVIESCQEKNLPNAVINLTNADKEQQPKEPLAGSDTPNICPLQKDKLDLEVHTLTCPESPLLSPVTLQKCPVTGTPGIKIPDTLGIPTIQVQSKPSMEKRAKEGVMGDTLLPPVPSSETSPRLRRRDSLTPIPSATPEELASGARRKIFIPKPKGEEVEGSDAQGKKEEVPKRRTLSPEQEAPHKSPSQSRRPSLLQLPAGQKTPPIPRRSPLVSRKKATLEVPKHTEDTAEEQDTLKTEPKSAEKDKLDPLKAPQVIRKIRGEPFPDTTGHLKLWCQFFNVLSDSTIRWYRDEIEIVEVNRSAGDESHVALAIVQVSSRDCGVYSCSIKNEYGMDSTDFLLSADMGEEIEMTPMLFSKGLADPGDWGNKFYGRIVIAESNIGEGCTRKACKVKVIYGLVPLFESGSTCIIKVRNPIPYGKKGDSNLVERNLEITKQECKVQNMIREYCKVFSAEARVAGNFGPVLEVIPLHLMYRPANTIPYATVEADLKGMFLKYCLTDTTGRLIMRTGSEVEQKCCTFQHWIHQWTNGNLLLTQLEGVDGKITNVGVATKMKGYQGLTDRATPKVFEQFVAQHQCNYYCGLLGLRSLQVTDSLAQPTKLKGSRSPMLNRRGSASPQLLRKGGTSPQTPRKVSSSPRLARRMSEPADSKPAVKHKTVEIPKAVRMR